jgi:hypothetical protein
LYQVEKLPSLIIEKSFNPADGEILDEVEMVRYAN